VVGASLVLDTSGFIYRRAPLASGGLGHWCTAAQEGAVMSLRFTRRFFDHRRNMTSSHPHRVLAVASGGGHWVQLLRMLPAFEGCQISYVTTLASYAGQVGNARFYAVRDASSWDKLGLLRMAARLFWVVLRERPDLVISTGAAPGYFALRIGKLFGARTIWVDSMANVEKLSLSGRLVERHADLWLTQWAHLASPEGPQFEGAVL